MKYIEKTIGQIFIENARKNPDKVYVKDGDLSLTCNNLFVLATKAAHTLQKEYKVQSGDYVGIYSRNNVEWLINFFALQLLGAKAVLFNPHFKYNTMENMIDKHSINLILYSNLEDNLNFFKTIDSLKERFDGICNFKNIKMTDAKIRESLKGDYKEIEPEKDFDEVALIIFTSGSTGLQKGVMLSHKSVINNAMATAKGMGWNEEDKVCVSVPFFHCFGLTTCILTSLLINSTLCIVPELDTKNVCRVTQEEKCTILNGVPSMFLAIVRKKCYLAYDITSLKSGIIAGSPIYSGDYKEITSAFKDFLLQPSYGQSEASPCITLCALDDSFKSKAKTVGKVIEDVKIRIRDLDTDELIKGHEVGEIECSGYNVMKGYLNDPEQSASVFTEDAWLKTGDLGYIDKKGYLRIAGRKKNLIIRCGENISPVMVENSIKQFDNSLEVVVLGTKVDVLQEEVVACFIGVRLEDSKLKELKEFLIENLPIYAVPKYYMFFEEAQLTSVGKVDLKALSKRVKKRIKKEMF